MEASRSDSITVLGLSISEKKRSRNVKQRPHSRPVREGTRVPDELLSTGDRGQEGAQSPAARGRRGPGAVPPAAAWAHCCAASEHGAWGRRRRDRPGPQTSGRQAGAAGDPSLSSGPAPPTRSGDKVPIVHVLPHEGQHPRPQPGSPDEMGSRRQTPLAQGCGGGTPSHTLGWLSLDWHAQCTQLATQPPPGGEAGVGMGLPGPLWRGHEAQRVSGGT